jgi:hypothetical protein
MHGQQNIKFVRICNTELFSTATMVTRTRQSITLYVKGLSYSVVPLLFLSAPFALYVRVYPPLLWVM